MLPAGFGSVGVNLKHKAGNAAKSNSMKDMKMNCFNIDLNRKKPSSRGIQLKGIEGVELGPNNLIPFNEECLSDPQRYLSKMTFDGLLVDADLASGEISPRNPTSINSLVKLSMETGLSSGESLFTGDGGVRVSAVETDVKIEQVVGPEFYLNPHGGRWTRNVAILMAIPPKSLVSIKWATKRVETHWFRKVELVTDHLAGLSMENGKPVFVQHY
jgi:hypothetical protein